MIVQIALRMVVYSCCWIIGLQELFVNFNSVCTKCVAWLVMTKLRQLCVTTCAEHLIITLNVLWRDIHRQHNSIPHTANLVNTTDNTFQRMTDANSHPPTEPHNIAFPKANNSQR